MGKVEAELSAELASTYLRLKRKTLETIRAHGLSGRSVVYATVQRVLQAEGGPPQPAWWVRKIMDKAGDALQKEAYRG